MEKAVAVVLVRPVPENGRTVGEISKACTLNRPATRPACAEVADLNAEAERPRESKRLTEKADDLRKQIEGVEGGQPIRRRTARRAAGAAPLQIRRRHLEVGLSALVALLIELGSGLGLFIATAPWRGQSDETGKGRAKRNPPKPKKGKAMNLSAVEEFMLACLESRPGGQLSGGDLYLAYSAWCGKAGLAPHNRTQLKRQCDELAMLAGIGFSGRGGNGVYKDVDLSAR